MIKFRRVAAILSTVAMLSTFVVSQAAFAASFADVDPSQYWYTHVEDLVGQGVLDTTNPDNFNSAGEPQFFPTQYITRAAAAQMVCAGGGYVSTPPTEQVFDDVPVDAWYAEPIHCLYERGIVSGDAGANTFRPGDNVTRAEFAKMIVNGLVIPNFEPLDPTFPDVRDTDWFYSVVESAYHYSVINGYSDGTFGPNNPIIRGDAAVMLVQGQNPEARTTDCPEGHEMVDGVCTVVVMGGDLAVSLSSNTPPVQPSIPAGATGVKVAEFDFTAGDTDVLISNLTIHRGDVGSPDDFAKVYLYHDGVKLGNGKTVNDTTNEVFFNNVGVMVDAGTTESIVVRVDLANPIANTGVHYFEVQSADKVVTSADTVTGAFPVRANQFGTSTLAAGKVDVESAGTDYTRAVGEMDAEVATFTVEIDNTEAAEINAITLYNDDDDVISNMKLYQGSTMVASGVTVGRYTTFMFDTPYALDRGQKVSFKVRGDVSGKEGDTAEFYIRYNTDVEVEGQTYFYNLYVDGDLGTADDSYVDEANSIAGGGAIKSNVVTVEAGQVTVAFNGPPTSDVSLDSTDVVLMNFTISSEANLDIEKSTIAVFGTGMDANDIDDLELVCDGQIELSESDPNVDTTLVAGAENLFNDVWQINAGQTRTCQIRVDILSTAEDGDQITAVLMDLTDAGDWTLRDSDTNDTVTDIVPSGNIQGHTMTITEASLEVTVAADPASGESYVKGINDLPIVGFIFQAGDSEDVTVNSVKLTAYADTDDADLTTPTVFQDANDVNQASNAEDVMGSVTIWEKESMTPLDSPDSLDVNAGDVTVQFDTLDWLIPQGQSKTLLATADITTTAPINATGDAVALGIEAAGDVDAEYGTGNSITITAAGGGAFAGANDDQAVWQGIIGGGALDLELGNLGSGPSDTPLAQLVAQSSTMRASTFKFAAQDEPYNIKKIGVTYDGDDGVAPAAIDADEVSSVTLTFTDSFGEIENVTQSVSGAVAQFTLPVSSTSTSNRAMFVPKDGEAYLDVKVTTQSVSSGGADNGDTFAMGISALVGTFEAIGVDSGTTIKQEADTGGGFAADEDLGNGAGAAYAAAQGSDHFLFESVPTIAWGANPAPGPASVARAADQKLGELVIGANGPSALSFNNAAGNAIRVDITESTCTNAAAPDDVFSLEAVDRSVVYDTVTIDWCLPNASPELAFDFTDAALSIPANGSKTLGIWGDVSELDASGQVQMTLSPTAANFDWGIKGTGSFETGAISFRGSPKSNLLTAPST